MSASPGPAALRERVRLGAYVRLAGRPPTDPVEPLDLRTLEAGLQRRFDVVHYFWGWGRPFDPALSANLVGRDLMLSWKPDAATLHELRSGTHDGYLDAFAAQARAYGRPVYLRFAWEMNGSWMDYSASSEGPDAMGYILAWQHVVGRFRAGGADNVHFIWCPNETDRPDSPGNHLENYWPGSEWVDLLGFDAYNWSNQQPRHGDGSWRTFHQLAAEPYRRLTALDASKPVWLCEWGTTEAQRSDPPGVSKAQWFAEAGAVTDFPRLAALVYFSEDDQRDTRRDWRLDSSPAALEAFGRAFPATG